MLELNKVRVSYGKALILDGIDMRVEQGELVAVIGSNGAGKTTLLRAISRVAPVEGSIQFQGRAIQSLNPVKVVGLGIAQCPEGRCLFPDLSVRENLDLGAYLRKDREEIAQDRDMVFGMFPVLAERQRQMAGTMSGGEQQMLAIGRALMARPALLLLDEPSTGLAVLVKRDISEKIKEIQKRGVTVILVEQDTQMAFELAERTYVLEQGRVALEGPTAEVANNPHVKEIYLGMA
ncbi:MAG: ABC transporter ATP-binding protein [Thermodesulfobacteriota bacterium]